MMRKKLLYILLALLVLTRVSGCVIERGGGDHWHDDHWHDDHWHDR